MLLDKFQSNKNLLHADKVNSIGSLHLERKKLPGLSLIKLESYFPVDVPWKSQNTKAVFSMHFMLHGSLSYSTHHLKSKFDKGQNNILIIPGKSNKLLLFNAKTFYSYRNFIFDNDYLESLSKKYPEALSDLYKKYQKGESCCLDYHNLMSTNEMNHILLQIDHASDMGNAAPMYIESKIMELMCLQIQSCGGNKYKPPVNFKISDLDKIREAAELLTQDLGCSPTVYQLSRKVGLNTKKLKYGFKEVFKNTIYGYLAEHKMNRARHLLLNTNLSVFEIGIECGYEHSSHFCTAFKRKFGVTPLQFKKTN